mgnify:CR=1 FL=1
MGREYSNDEIALCRRIEQVLSEILSDKYDCKVKIRFLPEEYGNGGRSDERAVGEDSRELCNHGA